ncbi:MAG: alpha-L-fucosidase [Clostridia bacterium]|nr:alpha-L-fucosidase [Clostridia bacterium]
MQPYELAAEVKPSERQLNWQKTEFYGFINFGLATVVNGEWTDGTVNPLNFQPDEFDEAEWVTFFKDAGFKGMVLNVKHHDGFCLWASDICSYSVAASENWETDDRDIVRRLSDECRRQGLKFGIAISPLDRHSKLYGSGELYNEYFKKLLREVLTNYGEFFCVRFDGLAEPDKKGNVQEYDWRGYYEVVRECQPGAVITLVGPDVRWYGNEWGVIRENEWSVVPERYSIYHAIDATDEPDKKKRRKEEKYELDLGSRKAIKKETDFIWYPCEVCVSLRDRWYYHKDDEYTAKTKDKLIKLYLKTVGANCALMLGVPPMKNGKFSNMDMQILKAFGYDLKHHYAYRVSQIGAMEASSTLSDEYAAANLLDKDENLTWRPAEGDAEPELIITLSEKDMFDRVVLQEHIANGQHVESFEVYLDDGSGKFKRVYKGGVIGYKRIVKLNPVEVTRVKVKITSYRGRLELESVTMY